jgi:hypothetical protein
VRATHRRTLQRIVERGEPRGHVEARIHLIDQSGAVTEIPGRNRPGGGEAAKADRQRRAHGKLRDRRTTGRVAGKRPAAMDFDFPLFLIG